MVLYGIDTYILQAKCNKYQCYVFITSLVSTRHAMCLYYISVYSA